MNHYEIAAEYLRREAASNKQPQGADCESIIRQMARDLDISPEEIAKAVIGHTIQGPC